MESMAAIAAAAAVGVLTAFSTACGGPRLERLGPADSAVCATLSGNAADLADRIRREYRSDPSLAQFAVDGKLDSNAVFPGDYQLRAVAANNPALERYVQLPPEARQFDLFFWDPLDRYWKSEYRAGGSPVEFCTRYILHFKTVGPGATSVEVLEYLPEVRTGRKFHLMGHSGPGFYDDIRSVAPTTADRVRVLEMVKRVAASAPK